MKKFLGWMLVAGTVAAAYYFYSWVKDYSEQDQGEGKKVRKNKQMLETEEVG